VCWYLSRALVTVLFSISILVIFGFSQEADAASPICGNEIIERPAEQCDPPSAETCDTNCLFITSGSGIVVSTTNVPQFCGLKQLAVSTEPVFTEVFLSIIFGETVDMQVSNEETLRVANTGSGDAVVNADLILTDGDRQTTDWESLAGDTFAKGNTRSHHLSNQPYSTMTPITDNPFIDVLPGQTDPEMTFIDRFLKVRPDVGFTAFGNAGTDLITFTQVLRLEVSCDPEATCPAGEFADNGECVPRPVG